MSTEQVRRDFDQIAQLPEPSWNHNSHYHPFIMRNIPDRFGRLLDVGTGSGSFSRLAATQCEEVIGIDLSSKMIERARSHPNVPPHVSYRQADFLNDLPDTESFDVIVSIAVVHHLPLDAFLRKAQQILRPGGRLIVIDLRRDESIWDIVNSGVAVLANQFRLGFHRDQRIADPMSREIWESHLQHDRYLSMDESRTAYATLLPGTIVRRHLYWRYSAIWTKPTNNSQRT
ncbi:MAG: class I SAM-dependent methyltransferase [Candidatus Obscuribacterales bacterium]|nr:class I SAM-dependent methyltransferase [Candidatus Obscuribacterales bacterium]